MSIMSSIFSSINYIFNLPEHIIEPIGWLPDFLKDALVDSLNLVPFLFIMFVFIEWIEIYFTKFYEYTPSFLYIERKEGGAKNGRPMAAHM